MKLWHVNMVAMYLRFPSLQENARAAELHLKMALISERKKKTSKTEESHIEKLNFHGKM